MYIVPWERVFVLIVGVWILLATSARPATADVVIASWNRNPESDTSTYILSYGTQSGVYTTSIDVGNVTTRQVTVAPGERYFFIVQARNIAGLTSLPSLEASIDLTDSATLTPSTVNFGVVNSGGTLTLTTPAQAVALSVQPGVTWTAAANQPWITVSPTSGSGSRTLIVSINNTGGVLPASGALGGTVTMTPSGGSPITLTVTLVIRSPQQTGTVPFGVLDTPAAATTIQGSVAVTGWALDDVAVDRVEIWRDLMPGETTPPFISPGHLGHGKVFIAVPFFVAGSRPDVQAAYPTHPLTHRAGWGYLLLTWGLWNQGNGPVTLYAFAYDQEGNATTLGTKTVTASNNTATRPFGAIDVPAYGETKSGLFFNFGWALTPNPNSADTRSCTITNGNVSVAIDSGPLTAVTYGDNRIDVAAAFPGFSNGSSGGGHHLIDTTTLSNGTHQIGWFAVDSCGRADGIGSRFFTVLNGSSLVAADDTGGSISPSLRAADVGSPGPEPPTESNALRARLTGSDWTTVQPNVAGVHIVEVGQSDRVEVHLPLSDGGSYAGVQVVDGSARDLPVGSSLDAERGIFYWQPAAGFLGGFDLEFFRVALDLGPAGAHSNNGPVRVRVVVGPPMRMAIDIPRSGVTRQRSITVAGWAIDLASADGSGVDTVHVWAYPLSGGAPIFIGVADIGDARPDVGATYGRTFGRSSYSLTANLSPGVFDIVVYPHRAATGVFEGAQAVRVEVR